MTDPLTALRARFRDRAAADRARLSLLLQSDPTSAELRRLVHNLAGAAGTFGFGPLSAAAGEIDDDMASGLGADPLKVARLMARLDEAAQAGTNLVCPQAAGPGAGEGSGRAARRLGVPPRRPRSADIGAHDGKGSDPIDKDPAP